MSFTVPNSAEILLLRYLLNNATPTNVKLHLYSNNHTPSESDTIANYTEVTASGYTHFSLSGSAWTFATSSGTSTASYARQSFTFSTSSTVYGLYITDSSNSNLILAEKFSSAFTIPGSGYINVDPEISLS